MRRFLIKVIIFILFPLFYFGINMAINRFIFLRQSVPIKNTSILIAGDSHAQFSLNPKYFTSAQNISQAAEPYLLTYWKLEKIFKTFTPDTLILGFGPHNISQFNDLKFSDKLYSSEMFKRSYPIATFNKKTDNNLIDYSNFYRVLWKQTAFYPKKNHINYIGNYYNNKSSNSSDWKITIDRHYYHEGKVLNVSKYAINYLDSIIKLCDSKNIVIVLISPPVHYNYLNNIPPSIMKEYDRLTTEYNNNYIVFNKTRDTYSDSLFVNSDHVNEYGAKRYTLELIQYLSNKEQTKETH